MLLASNWWTFLIRGLLALIFGVVAIFAPQAAFLSVILFFGAFALLDGVLALVAAFSSNAKSENWWWLIFEGVIGIIIGVLTILDPFAMGQAWLLLFAIWAIVTGVFEIVTAVRVRKSIEGELWLILSGIASIIFGIIVLTYPLLGAFVVGFLIGIYALVFGMFMLMLAFRLRGHKRGGAAQV